MIQKGGLLAFFMILVVNLVKATAIYILILNVLSDVLSFLYTVLTEIAYLLRDPSCACFIGKWTFTGSSSCR